MNQRLLPTEIILTDIPAEGRSYRYDDQGAELTPALQEVLGDRPYEIEFSLKPAGNVFLLEGRFKAELDLPCSRCGEDLHKKLNEKVSEILVMNTEEFGRKDSSARANHRSDIQESQQEATFLAKPEWAPGPFFRELMALAEPYQAVKGPECYVDCKNLEKAYQAGWLERPGADLPEEKTYKPFAQLEDLKKKLNS